MHAGDAYGDTVQLRVRRLRQTRYTCACVMWRLEARADVGGTLAAFDFYAAVLPQ